jgi:1-phosphofructokinase
MNQIITLTLNPSLDRTIYLEEFEPGKTLRTGNVYEELGGKGINVSKALNNLGQSSVCIGIVGENIKLQIKTFVTKYPLVETNFIKSNNPTRICSDYIFPNGDFKVNENGPEQSKKLQNRIIKKVKSLLANDQIWVLSGSLPNGFDSDFYTQLIKIIHTSNSKIFLDTSGNALKVGISQKPFLIKPNLHECQELMGTKITSIQTAKNAVKTLLSQGLPNVALSLGEKGLILGNQNKILYFKAPAVNTKKVTGAGDGLVAGLVYGLINNYSLADLGLMGVCVGSLSTTFEHVEYPFYQDVIELFAKHKSEFANNTQPMV